ncbi:uncharacterized protein LOC103188198 isoform X2 [Callorhinchus milii]|uniref:uncharacterized protein LOC103188198 isoform X2 n=1 Tax=Callorhinchus milii TaxID=7868 RepID=UPI000457209F|nr:uncharacterized protein LOC103188198 isoform X2 [Callorhinchus milii]|eukprot:gi/632979106/ref/XP_007906284.1/ PREDICTED: uncharacterized protein C17orf105 homolog isoform X2 [Callorhinchus milii]
MLISLRHGQGNMHRSYQPAVPTCNRYLQQRWDQADYQQHKSKLEEERLAQITRDNQILSSKLADIVNSKGTVQNWNSYSCKSLNVEKRQREQARISQENQATLQRIVACESEYSQARLRGEWERVQRLRSDIGRYPRRPQAQQESKKKKICMGEEERTVSGESSGSEQEEKNTEDSSTEE